MASRAVPGLGLQAFWALGENGWKEGMDWNLFQLSVLTNCAVIGKIASLPGSPTQGDSYILTSGPNINRIAVRDADQWVFLTPLEGWEVYDKSTDRMTLFNGTEWFDPYGELDAAVAAAEAAAEAAQGVEGGRALVYPEAPALPVYNAGGRKIGALADGTATDHAATFGQLSAAIAALGALAGKDVVAIADLAEAALKELTLVNPNGPRSVIRYFATYRVQICAEKSFAMGGFRYHGQYDKGRAPVFAAPAFDEVYTPGGHRHIIDLGNGTTTKGDLGAENRHTKENWYALFACANDGDETAVFKFMPFLRANQIGAGGVPAQLSFKRGGENRNNDSTVLSYNMPAGALNGVDCLVINETINNRENAFSGRVTKIVASGVNAVVLEDIGNIAYNDYLLPAPPGYEHYRYIGSCYMDTHELRNIADTGTLVHSRGSNSDRNINGELPALGVDIPIMGNICPLATAVMIQETQTVSSGTTGRSYSTWGMDNSHNSIVTSWYKSTTGSDAWSGNAGLLPFSFSPWINLRGGGALNIAANTRQLNLYGWIEP